jgi:hypothetical protein
MLQNYLVLPSQRRGPIEGKEDRFLRKEQVPRILREENGIFAFKRIPVISLL